MTFPTVTIKLNNASAFDEAVHGGLPEGGDLTVITKDEGTQSGRACVCLTFSVEVDGKVMRAQHVTTVRCLATVLKALEGRYEDGRAKS